ncbi:MAG: MATE family efflux transporter [Bacilli bacterium]
MTESTLSKNEALMRYGNIRHSLIVLGIPSMIAMIITALYNFIDTLFIGFLNDAASLAAVSLSTPIFIIIGAIGALIGVGGSSLVSRSMGALSYETANKAASLSIGIFVVVAIIVSGICIVFLPSMLKVLGADAEVLPAATQFTGILVGGSVFTIGVQVLNALVRAEGAVKASMYSLILGAIINIILDPLFMFVFKWGLAGAAIATVIAQGITFLYLLAFFLKGKGKLVLSLCHIKAPINENLPVIKEIFIVGMPIFLLQILFCVSNSLMNRYAANYGTNALAAFGVASRIYQLPVLMFMGFIQGFQPFAAYNYGAKAFERIREGLHFTFKLLISMGICVMLFFHFFAGDVVQLFSSNIEVQQIATNTLLDFYISVDNLRMDLLDIFPSIREVQNGDNFIDIASRVDTHSTALYFTYYIPTTI